MFINIKILLLLIVYSCCYAAHDNFILRNNTPDEQKIVLRFRSRLLLRNNNEIIAPTGFTFVNERDEKTSLINPDLPIFTEFQRKNFDVVTESEIILAPSTAQTIALPYPLTRIVCISSSTHDQISLDLEDLYYTGSLATTDNWLDIRKQDTLKSVSEKVIAGFSFSKAHNVPNPVNEAMKAKNLRSPSPFIRKVYSKTDEEALRGIHYLEEKSLEILDIASSTAHATSSGETVPKKTHRMWLTNPNAPIEPPVAQLEYYINSIARLNLSTGWTHKFWCWDKRQLPITCQILENCGQNIEIVEFCNPEELSKIIASQFVYAAIDHGLFTLAGNILRNNVLFHEGGFYTDIGAEVKHDLSPLLQHSDIIAHHRVGRVDRSAWWIDHDFMGARARSPIIRDFLNRINTLHELSDNSEVVDFFKAPRLAHSWTNARLLTEIFSLFSESYGTRTLILPNDESIIAAHHQTSWYGGDGKSCKDIDKTTLNWFKVTPDYKILHDGLIADGFNLQLYQQYFAPTLTSPGELTHHFLSQNLGVLPFAYSAERPLPVTVTLTSWTGKIKDAHIGIISLLNQNFKPNNLILWLANEEFPDKKIPLTLSHLLSKGLEIRWCENIRSAKKLISSLRDSQLRETLLVTADDDIVYRPDWIESLYLTHREYPSCIIAHRTRVMKFNEDSTPAKYSKWRLLTDPSIAAQKILFPTSGGGMLFPPNSLHLEVLNSAKFMELCPTGDDIFWFAMAILQGTKIRVPTVPQTTIVDINDAAAAEVSLWTTNQSGRNDEMIKAVFAEYSIYDLLKTQLHDFEC